MQIENRDMEQVKSSFRRNVRIKAELIKPLPIEELQVMEVKEETAMKPTMPLLQTANKDVRFFDLENKDTCP